MSKINFHKGMSAMLNRVNAARAANAAKKSSRTPTPVPKWADSMTYLDNAVLQYGAAAVVLLSALVAAFFGVKYAVQLGTGWYAPVMMGFGAQLYLNTGVTSKRKQTAFHGIALIALLAASVILLLIYRRGLFSASIATVFVTLCFMHNEKYGTARDLRKCALRAMAVVAVGVGLLAGLEKWLPDMLALSMWHSVWLVPLLTFGIMSMACIAMGSSTGLQSGIIAGVLVLIRAGMIASVTLGFANMLSCFCVMIPVAFLPAMGVLFILFHFTDSDW